MKLPGFFGGQKQKEEVEYSADEILLALDIGTEFVKAVLFSINKAESNIEVVGYGRSRQHSAAMSGAMIVNIDNVISACDRAIGTALHHADRTLNDGLEKGAEGYEETPLPTRAVVGIAGELVRGVTIAADYERDEPDAKITPEERDEVIEQIKGQAFQGAIDDIAAEIGVPTSRLQEISSKISATFIDGQKVDSPLGFTGNEVSYKIFSTFAPTMHINSLKEITNALGLEIISIEVEPYAVARAIKGARAATYGSIIIDVGGGTTDVALVDKGSVIGTKMFAYGGKVFTKRVAETLRIDLHQAEAEKIKYSNQLLGDTQAKQLASALNKDIKIWAEGVELALEEMEDVDEYPAQIYICGGGSALPEIKAGLTEHPWLQVLPFLKYPKVEHLFPSQLEDINDKTGSIIAPEDVTPLALARMVLELDEQ